MWFITFLIFLRSLKKSMLFLFFNFFSMHFFSFHLGFLLILLDFNFWYDVCVGICVSFTPTFDNLNYLLSLDLNNEIKKK